MLFSEKPWEHEVKGKEQKKVTFVKIKISQPLKLWKVSKLKLPITNKGKAEN